MRDNKTQDDILLEDIIDNYYFKDMASGNKNLELFIDSDCNLKCSYCYIFKHKKELSPDTSDKNKILENIEEILSFIDSKVNGRYAIDIFSGEFFMLPYWEKVLDILLRHNEHISCIVIPTNMTFTADKELEKRVQEYIDMFLNKSPIYLSASCDGLILEKDTRSAINEEGFIRDDEYFENIFSFCNKNKIGFHPMVSSYSIDKWTENYLWYMYMYKKYDYFGENPCTSGPMMLEVRDNDWTERDIQYYLEFLNNIIYEKTMLCQNESKENKDLYIKSLFLQSGGKYNNIAITNQKDDMKGISCAIQSSLAIRCVDKAIISCHRTSYEQFVAGHIVESNKIKAKNINTYVSILSAKGENLPGCNKCSIKDYCIKGCIGSQYEYSNELFIPNKNVCKLFKAKFAFLLKRYVENGYVEIFLNMKPDNHHMEVCQKNLIDIMKKMNMEKNYDNI